MGKPNEEVDHFVICLLKYLDGIPSQAKRWVDEFKRTVNEYDGNLHLWSDDRTAWDIIEGRDHLVEPNHLNPAIFNFDCIIVFGFRSASKVHAWWSSDEVFNLVKTRDPIEKMGIFVIQGLQRSTDLAERCRFHAGDKFVLFELMKIESYKPMVDYVANYKRFMESGVKMKSNLLFAEGVAGVLMNELPLDLACASSWRMYEDAHEWYNTELYRKHLLPLRRTNARCISMLIPLFVNQRVSVDELERAKKALTVAEKLSRIVRVQ